MKKWKDVEGYPNYQVSNDGEVRSAGRIVMIGHGRGTPKYLPARVLKQATNEDGHRRVQLFHGRVGKCLFVHRLVAKAFVKGSGPLVRHMNGVPHDNRASNLKWGTVQDNAEDAKRLGELRKGESHPMAKLTVDNVLEIRMLLWAGYRQHVVASWFGVRQGTISRIHHRKGWHVEATAQ